MGILPLFEDFARQYEAGQPQLLHTTRTADLETPVSAFLKLHEPGSRGFLLESVQGGEVRGRYSVIGLEPDMLWQCIDGKASISTLAGGLEHFVPESTPAIESLKAAVDASRIPAVAGLPPMATGLFGFLGYDMVRQMERLPEPNGAEINLPDALLMRPGVMVIFDAVGDEIQLIVPARPDGRSAREAYDAGVEHLNRVVSRLGRQLIGHQAYDGVQTQDVTFTPCIPPEKYHQMVNEAKEYIAAGDIFQVVLSQRFKAEFYLPHFSFYRALRHLNPSPFLFYFCFGNFSLVGSSPEIMVRLRDGKVTIRPIAGTRKRGATAEEDLALEHDLLADPKELAEHLMLLDLGRNDVGRVSVGGSVKVTERMKVERYSHVMHIVSNVEGTIKPGMDAVDALVGGFPAGTVSGAPKIRAMEIIDSLESVKREFYAGCAGYFGADGALDTCINLRTVVIKDNMIYAQAGAGIVADSVPESEHQECVNKAKAMMRAASEAGRFV